MKFCTPLFTGGWRDWKIKKQGGVQGARELLLKKILGVRVS